MNHFHLIATKIPIGDLLKELDAHPELWGQHRARLDAPGTPHGGSQDIWARYQDIGPFERGERPWSEINDKHEPVWYPSVFKLPSLRVICAALEKHTNGILYGVLVTKIPPGGRIKPHKDDSWHVRWTEKFYLSLRSEPGADFICHDEPAERLNPSPGEIWLFDNRKTHSVENNSKSDRVTAIICIHTDKYGRDYGCHSQSQQPPSEPAPASTNPAKPQGLKRVPPTPQ